MARIDNQIELAEVLREYETNDVTFTPAMLAARTAYTAGSVRKYITEKLLGKYVFHNGSRSHFQCKDLTSVSNDDFVALMSQSAKPKELTADKRLHMKLVERSLDAFTLALEVYNRPSMKNRVEAFAIMMVNAWELFLKAELLKLEGQQAIFFKEERSISIAEAIKKRLQENDPVRKNLETLVELRDQSVHLLIPELQPQLSRLFQSTVLNYQIRYKNEIGNAPIAGQSVGMLSLVIDGPATEIAVIQKQYGQATAQMVARFLTSFDQTTKDLDSNEFSIPIDYKLALVKRKDKSDVSLSVGDDGAKAIILNKTVDLEVTHPYHMTTAIEEINKLQPCKINQWSFQAVLSKHKIKSDKKSALHYKLDDRPRYSKKFIEWFVKNLNQPGWLESAREHYRHSLKKNKKSAKV